MQLDREMKKKKKKKNKLLSIEFIQTTLSAVIDPLSCTRCPPASQLAGKWQMDSNQYNPHCLSIHPQTKHILIAPSAPSPAQPSPAYPHATAVQYGAKYLPHLPSSYLYTPVCTTYDIDAAREFDFTRTLRDAAGVCGWKMEDGRCVEWIKCRAAAAYPPVRPPARPPACTPARADGGCGGNWGMEGEGFVCHREDGLDMRGWKDGEVAMYVDEVRFVRG
ncbi:hypothetical protein IWX47DRAFT_595530 [Phyllosticta citricarpa]